MQKFQINGFQFIEQKDGNYKVIAPNKQVRIMSASEATIIYNQQKQAKQSKTSIQNNTTSKYLIALDKYIKQSTNFFYLFTNKADFEIEWSAIPQYNVSQNYHIDVAVHEGVVIIDINSGTIAGRDRFSFNINEGKKSFKTILYEISDLISQYYTKDLFVRKCIVNKNINDMNTIYSNYDVFSKELNLGCKLLKDLADFCEK